jgi:pyruvate dehydrogenase E1 component beta subunit
MREGTDVTLVAFGKLVGYNLKVAEELEKEGISCEVPCCPSILQC